ncbi:MAG: hypothetical protein AB8H86_17760 [Polyangiales bacterium]
MSLRTRLAALWLVVPLFGCVDSERIYVEVGAGVAMSAGATVLLCFGLAAAWRRWKGRNRSDTVFARVVSRTLIGLALVILVIATLGLLRVAVIGRPLALTGYIWLYASPLIWAAILVYEARIREHTSALRGTLWATLAYVLLFSAVCVTFWPGPRIPSAAVVEIAVSRQSVCERFDGGEVVCRGVQQGAPGRWPIPIDAPSADAIYLVNGQACLRTSTPPSEVWCWTQATPSRQETSLDPVAARASWIVRHETLERALHEAEERSFSPSRACLIKDQQVQCATAPGFSAEPPSLRPVQALSPADHVVVDGEAACSWLGPLVRCDGAQAAGEFRFEANVENVTLGRSHACALSDKEVHCWGLGRNGALGTGTEEDQAAPERVDLDDVEQLAGAGTFTCARTGGEDGANYCWGIAPPRVTFNEEPTRVPNRRLRDIFRRQVFRARPTLLRQ